MPPYRSQGSEIMTLKLTSELPKLLQFAGIPNATISSPAAIDFSDILATEYDGTAYVNSYARIPADTQFAQMQIDGNPLPQAVAFSEYSCSLDKTNSENNANNNATVFVENTSLTQAELSRIILPNSAVSVVETANSVILIAPQNTLATLKKITPNNSESAIVNLQGIDIEVIPTGDTSAMQSKYRDFFDKYITNTANMPLSESIAVKNVASDDSEINTSAYTSPTKAQNTVEFPDINAKLNTVKTDKIVWQADSIAVDSAKSEQFVNSKGLSDYEPLQNKIDNTERDIVGIGINTDNSNLILQAPENAKNNKFEDNNSPVSEIIAAADNLINSADIAATPNAGLPPKSDLSKNNAGEQIFARVKGKNAVASNLTVHNILNAGEMPVPHDGIIYSERYQLKTTFSAKDYPQSPFLSDGKEISAEIPITYQQIAKTNNKSEVDVAAYNKKDVSYTVEQSDAAALQSSVMLRNFDGNTIFQADDTQKSDDNSAGNTFGQMSGNLIKNSNNVYIQSNKPLHNFTVKAEHSEKKNTHSLSAHLSPNVPPDSRELRTDISPTDGSYISDIENGNDEDTDVFNKASATTENIGISVELTTIGNAKISNLASEAELPYNNEAHVVNDNGIKTKNNAEFLQYKENAPPTDNSANDLLYTLSREQGRISANSEPEEEVKKQDTGNVKVPDIYRSNLQNNLPINIEDISSGGQLSNVRPELLITLHNALAQIPIENISDIEAIIISVPKNTADNTVGNTMQNSADILPSETAAATKPEIQVKSDNSNFKHQNYFIGNNYSVSKISDITSEPAVLPLSNTDVPMQKLGLRQTDGQIVPQHLVEPQFKDKSEMLPEKLVSNSGKIASVRSYELFDKTKQITENKPVIRLNNAADTTTSLPMKDGRRQQVLSPLQAVAAASIPSTYFSVPTAAGNLQSNTSDKYPVLQQNIGDMPDAQQLVSDKYAPEIIYTATQRPVAAVLSGTEFFNEIAYSPETQIGNISKEVSEKSLHRPAVQMNDITTQNNLSINEILSTDATFSQSTLNKYIAAENTITKNDRNTDITDAPSYDYATEFINSVNNESNDTKYARENVRNTHFMSINNNEQYSNKTLGVTAKDGVSSGGNEIYRGNILTDSVSSSQSFATYSSETAEKINKQDNSSKLSGLTENKDEQNRVIKNNDAPAIKTTIPDAISLQTTAAINDASVGYYSENTDDEQIAQTLTKQNNDNYIGKITQPISSGNIVANSSKYIFEQNVATLKITDESSDRHHTAENTPVNKTVFLSNDSTEIEPNIKTVNTVKSEVSGKPANTVSIDSVREDEALAAAEVLPRAEQKTESKIPAKLPSENHSTSKLPAENTVKSEVSGKPANTVSIDSVREDEVLAAAEALPRAEQKTESKIPAKLPSEINRSNGADIFNSQPTAINDFEISENPSGSSPMPRTENTALHSLETRPQVQAEKVFRTYNTTALNDYTLPSLSVAADLSGDDLSDISSASAALNKQSVRILQSGATQSEPMLKKSRRTITEDVKILSSAENSVITETERQIAPAQQSFDNNRSYERPFFNGNGYLHGRENISPFALNTADRAEVPQHTEQQQTTSEMQPAALFYEQPQIFQQLNIAPLMRTLPKRNMIQEFRQVDATRTTEYAVQLAENTPSGSKSSVVLHLRPESLGAVTLSVAVNGSGVSVAINVETADARQAVAAQVSSLREQLAKSGISAQSIEVRQQPQDATFQQSGGFMQSHGGGGRDDQEQRQAYLRSFRFAADRHEVAENTDKSAKQRIISAGAVEQYI
ncbi:hypothetical protein MASR2M18_06450 [Ignavibacteria bacterium]